MTDHANRSIPDEAPYMSMFKNMDMDQRWVHRFPQTMLETFHWFHAEGFGSIVEHLLRSVIVEGFRLLSRLVTLLLT